MEKPGQGPIGQADQRSTSPSPTPTNTDRTRPLFVAWASLLLYPIGVYWSVFSDRPLPLAIAFSSFGAVLLLLGLVVRSPSLGQLRGHLLVAAALSAGGLAVLLIERTSAWTAWAVDAPTYDLVFADSALELIPCALMALTFVGSGLSRRDVFLAKGDLGRPVLQFGRWTLTWTQLAPIGILLFAGPVALQLASTVRPDFHEVGRAAAALPAAIAFGVFNAAQEEFRFRAALLPRLTPVIGASQSMLLTATVFGIAHWHGHPSGPTGVLLTGLGGWWLARSMIKTEGSSWAWSVHAALDVMIFLSLVMGS